MKKRETKDTWKWRGKKGEDNDTMKREKKQKRKRNKKNKKKKEKRIWQNDAEKQIKRGMEGNGKR